MGTMWICVISCCLAMFATGVWVDLERSGAVPDDRGVAIANTHVLNVKLAELQPRDTLFISNRTFWVAGGVRAVNLKSVTIRLDGTLRFLPGRDGWPLQRTCGTNPLQPVRGKTCVQEAFYIANVSGLTLTSSGTGTLDGSGQAWWGYINYIRFGEDRPRLLSMINVVDALVERWRFVNSPYWTFTAFDVARMEVRHCAIDNRVNGDDEHSTANLAALNTDGFDVSGKNIHIHHSSVWNQDDCFTVQPTDSTGVNAHCTENVLIEDVNASGLGLTIGAVRPTQGHNCVRNVTFRRAVMHHTFKGIYVKSQHSDDPKATAELTNLLYEDIDMDSPTQVPIWIGPAQEADSKDACSLVWPELPFAKCPPPQATVRWTNITLRNIRVHNPKQSPGVVYGNPESPMEGVVFDGVTVSNPGRHPWGSDFYKCEGVHGQAIGNTFPAPPCFRENSAASQQLLI